MRGLTIIVAGADAARFDAALTLANAHAALGGRARLYLHDAAVTLAMPTDLYRASVELGVSFIACQTALDVHRVVLPAGWGGGGMIGLLADLDDDRLVIVSSVIQYDRPHPGEGRGPVATSWRRR